MSLLCGGGGWTAGGTFSTTTHNLQPGTGSGSGSGVAAGVRTGPGPSESLSPETRNEASDEEVSVTAAPPPATHLWEIIFSAVSPSVMVTLLLLMCAPLGLDGE